MLAVVADHLSRDRKTVTFLDDYTEQVRQCVSPVGIFLVSLSVSTRPTITITQLKAVLVVSRL